MAVSKRTRFEVMRRDDHACRYCGGMAPDVKLTVDHVIPVALGGSDDPSNLVTACRDCNSGKASTAPTEGIVADVSARDIQFAEALRQAAQELSQIDPDDPGEVYAAEFDAIWNGYHTASGEVPRPRQWRSSVKAFQRSGLPIDSLREAVDIAMNKKGVDNDAVFRYMCGIAWRKITAIQDRAAEIMAQRAKEPDAVELDEFLADIEAEKAED